MENGSISAVLIVLVEVFEVFDRRGQKVFFSGGEGCPISGYPFIVLAKAYWEVDPAIIDDCSRKAH